MIPPAVLAAYPPEVRDCTWTLLPSGGGLSGGRVWRGDRNGEPLFAFKRWPAAFTPERMRTVHERMEEVEEFGFVARLLRTHSNTTSAVHAGSCWDVTEWQPGTSDLLTRASSAQLRAAGSALAALHRVWLPLKSEVAPCSVIARRLKLLNEWEQPRFQFNGRPEEVAEVVRTVEVVHRQLASARKELLRLSNLRGRVVGIHGDFWPENVLFQHERLTAVLDFGNVGFDHPEVDLGRLFADVPGADRPMIAAAVAAYNAAAPFDLSVPLVEVLASTGRLGSLANWHLRLNVGSPDAGLLATALPRIRRLAALAVAG
jgi:aminoglycoside phosphotransferase (APT) family kinase protein